MAGEDDGSKGTEAASKWGFMGVFGVCFARHQLKKSCLHLHACT